MTKFLASIAILLFTIMDDSSAMKKNYSIEKLILNGSINEAAYKKVLAFLKEGGKTIIINSEGGDVKFGQKIGMAIADKDVTLIVDKYCLSSCANYLFLSAKSKNLRPNAVLGFHGGVGIKSIDVKGLASSVTRPLNVLIKNEKLFFKKINANYEIIILSGTLTRSEISYIDVEINGKGSIKKTFNGDQEGLAVQLISEALEEDATAKFSMTMRNEIENRVYFPSKKTLLKYGVKGIENYPYPKSQIELDEIAKRVDEDLKVVGEFKIIEL